MITAGLLLAAGRSTRFGAADKLLAEFDGAPLVAHAAGALRGAGLDVLLAVADSPDVAQALLGFEIVSPCGAGDGAPPAQSASLRAGVARAEALGAERLLVVLGDMPLVDTALLRAVLARATDGRAAATTDGRVRAPPACWPRARFAELRALGGDRGAGQLLRALPEAALVRAPQGGLLDIDTRDDLRRALLRAPGTGLDRPAD